MEQQNVYPQSNNGNVQHVKNWRAGLKARATKLASASGAVCMALAMLCSNPSNAQITTVTRTSKVVAGVSPTQDSLWTFNMDDNYKVVKRLSPSVPATVSYTVTGSNGLATDPTTGDHYAIAQILGDPFDMLVRINIQTGSMTEVGSLGDNFAGITFNAAGTLFGITANSLGTPFTVFTIDKSSAATTFFRDLSGDAAAEVIAFCTDNNLLYRWTGNGILSWGRFNDIDDVLALEDLTSTITGATPTEVLGALYIGGGKMLTSDVGKGFRLWDTSGSVSSVFATAPSNIRGLVMETHTTSISSSGSVAICPGSTVDLTVVGGTGGYQWYKDGALMGGEVAVTLTASVPGRYNCVYADANGIIDSPVTGINVSHLEVPSITITPNPAVCFGVTTASIPFSTNSSYSFSSSPYTYVVPEGVTAINFDIMGGAGGNDTSAGTTPGKGGRLTGQLVVTPGDVLTVTTGGAGAIGTIAGALGGANGGGASFGFGGSGGGATDIRRNGTTLGDRVAVAGGGAGSGYDTTLMATIFGGNGGALTAADGGFNSDGFEAKGGSLAAGGAGAMFTGFAPGGNGMLGFGGDGSADGVSGGGGGGFNGGGGGLWSGGGGGSSFAAPGLVSGDVHTQGYNAGSGQADISYPVPAAYTYSIVWDAAAITAGFADVTNAAFPTGSAFSVSIPTTATPDTYTGTLTINNGLCDQTQAISVRVKPIPDVTATADLAGTCNGASTVPVAFAGTLPSTVFNWTNSISTIGLAASGSGDIASFTAVNNTTATQVAEVVVTPVLEGCAGPTDTFNITVYPSPTLEFDNGNICDNIVFNYTASSLTTGAFFAWERGVAPAGITATPATGTGTNTISETFDNTSTDVIAVAYTFTVTANGCENTDVLNINVNPTPTLTPVLTPSICNGIAFIYTQSSATAGVVYSWSRDTVIGIGNSPTSGTGNINETLNNTTADPITVTYVDTLNINGCKYTENVSVEIYPTPTLTSSLTPPSICDNQSFVYTATTATSGTNITWERNTVAGIASPYATGTDTVDEMHDNTTFSPITVTYDFMLEANGCANHQDVTAVVNPTATLNTTLAPAAICDSSFFDYEPASTTPGATFTWSRAAVPNITNPTASGTDNPMERLRNAATFPVPVTYVFTSTIDGCNNDENVVVTVNPRPRLSNTAPTPICDSTLFSFNATSMTLGSTYAWTRPYIGGIGALEGSDTVGAISERLKNNTYTNLNVVYIYTVTANGCSRVERVSVLVHPSPDLSSHLVDSACSGIPFTYAPTTNLIPSVDFAWSRASVVGISPANGAGVGGVNETLINPTTGILDVVYVYTVTVGGTCFKTADLAVKVRPAAAAPSIAVMPPSSLCSGTMFQNFGAATPAATGVEYAWSATNADVYATGSGKQYSLVSFPTTGTAVVTLTSTIGTTGCAGVATYTVNVTSAEAPTPSVIYTSGGAFICLQNNVDNFQWGYDDATTLDSVMFTGETNQSYFNSTPNFSARHYWVMINSGGCMQKAYYNAPADNTPRVVTNYNDVVTEMKVFPNPANSNVNVELVTAAPGTVKVELMNVLGQVVKSVSAESRTVSFDIASLPAGVYVIDCYLAGGKVGTAKFVKN